MSTVSQWDEINRGLTMDEFAEALKDPLVSMAFEAVRDATDSSSEDFLEHFCILRERWLVSAAPELLPLFVEDPEVKDAIRTIAKGRGKGAFIRFGGALNTLQTKGLLRVRDEPEKPQKRPLKVVGDAALPSQGKPRTDFEQKKYQEDLLEQSLPRNPAVEARVLAALIRFKGCRDSMIERLGPEQFHSAANRALLRAIVDVHSKKKGSWDLTILLGDPAQTTRIKEAGGEGVVETISRLPSEESHVESDLDELVELSIRREAAKGIHELAEVIKKGGSQSEISQAAVGIASRIDLNHPPEAFDFKNWPAPPDQAVYRGVVGELVAAISPHSEADPIAILAQLLVVFGSVIGRGSHWEVESTKHFTNMFACLVGPSGRGRKGTAWKVARNLFGSLDPKWMKDCIKGGLSTGEGLIKMIQDDVGEGENFVRGNRDKRLLCVETEFGTTLGIMGRESNSLSGTLRRGWDGDDLGNASKNDPLTATDPHVSLIGHTTFKDLEVNMSANNLRNGLANRIIWLCVRRSKSLPRGGDISKVRTEKFVSRIQTAVRLGRDPKRLFDPIEMDRFAGEKWDWLYEGLLTERPGNVGCVVNRAEAQVRRIALLYALLDGSTIVKLSHLDSALALWEYAERSATYIFGDSAGSPESDKLFKAIKSAGKSGLTRTEVKVKVFSNRKSADHYLPMLEALIQQGLISEVPDPENPKIRLYKSQEYLRSATFATITNVAGCKSNDTKTL